jgi:starch-binding outer membrane protein, SusD/RagB family
MKLKTLSLGLLAAGLLAACDSPLDTNPSSQIPADEALDSPDELAVAVNGLYDAYQDNGIDFGRNLLIYPELYADNLDFFDTYVTDEEVVGHDVQPTNGGVAGLWQGAYDGINRANEILAAIPEVEALSDEEAAQFRGEALFVRAHMYFILAEFFGGVPLVETPTRGIPTPEQAQVARATLAQTYALVERDLREAANLLGEPEFNGRAGYYAAIALLARVNLYAGDYAEAYAFADEVISEGPYELVSDYEANWRNKNGPESILEVQYTVNDPASFATWLHYGGRFSFSPSESLAEAYFLPVGEDEVAFDDERFGITVSESPGGAPYVGKYFRVESGDDNFIILRLAEMYLIRSEAAARLGNLTQAVDDINTLRDRVSTYSSEGELLTGPGHLSEDVDTRDEILVANLEERRRELAVEGHRFFDLRRMRDVPEIGAIVDELYFGDEFRLLFPIPQTELDTNELLTQNPGY